MGSSQTHSAVDAARVLAAAEPTGSTRRQVLVTAASLFAAGLPTPSALAKVPAPYDWNASPPTDSRDRLHRLDGEEPRRGPAAFLGQRFDRFQALLGHHDLWDKRDMRAYLLTPREEFVTSAEPRPGV